MNKKQVEIEILKKLLDEAKSNVQSYCRCKTLDRYDDFIEHFIKRVENDTITTSKSAGV